jgi:glycosyltransferase involved in cell wall biosynthesis
LVADKAFLVPTAHDEPPIYLSIFQELFSKPRGLIFSTPEEKDFLVNRFQIDCAYSDVIGVGIQFDPSSLHRKPSELKLPENYVIYVGRIDESKGCKELFEFWEVYKKRNEGDLKLLLVGRSQMEIPERHDIIALGFLSEEDKFAAISNAKCLIMPSVFESLSIVVMESWLCNRPVLVNGRCAVLKGQCRRSNGGLWYEGYDDFEASLNFVLTNEDLSQAMAESGRRFTIDNYNWGKIKSKYMALMSKFLGKDYAAEPFWVYL